MSGNIMGPEIFSKAAFFICEGIRATLIPNSLPNTGSFTSTGWGGSWFYSANSYPHILTPLSGRAIGSPTSSRIARRGRDLVGPTPCLNNETCLNTMLFYHLLFFPLETGAGVWLFNTENPKQPPAKTSRINLDTTNDQLAT